MYKYVITRPPQVGYYTRYPLYITSVKHLSYKSPKHPNGLLRISGYDQRRGFSVSRKCEIAKLSEKRFCAFGNHRLYEGYKGPVHLIGVPAEEKEKISALAAKYGSIVE